MHEHRARRTPPHDDETSMTGTAICINNPAAAAKCRRSLTPKRQKAVLNFISEAHDANAHPPGVLRHRTCLTGSTVFAAARQCASIEASFPDAAVMKLIACGAIKLNPRMQFEPDIAAETGRIVSPDSKPEQYARRNARRFLLRDAATHSTTLMAGAKVPSVTSIESFHGG
jgi:hypothetical protein